MNNPKSNSNYSKGDDAHELDMVDDMIGFLDKSSDARDGGGSLKLTKDNIKAIIMDVMFGGTETVASAIEWALAELMKNPEDMRRVQEELVDVVGLNRKVNESDLDKLPFFKCCIKEVLRLHPPIPILLHESVKDCEVSGYSIPAKSRVMINVWAIGRDKSAWGHDADTFRPSRFMVDEKASQLDFRGGFFEFLPFGSGRRSCPGMQLGLYGLEMSLSQLLHCFTWNLPHPMKPSELDMGDMFGLTAPKAIRLVAVPTPRLNCSIFS